MRQPSSRLPRAQHWLTFAVVAAASCAPSVESSLEEPIGSQKNALFGEEMQGTQLVGDVLGAFAPNQGLGKDGVWHVSLPDITVDRGMLVDSSGSMVVSATGTAVVLGGKQSFPIRVVGGAPSNATAEAQWDIGGYNEPYWQKPFTWLYDVVVLVSGQWVPFCSPYRLPADTHSSTKAVPIDAYWDGDGTMHWKAGTNITLACLSGVAAKCYKWRYAPWVDADMPDMHWACTRAARADYCGDGRSFTCTNTIVDVYDRRPVRFADADPSQQLSFESGWETGGARCITHLRYADLDPDGSRLCPGPKSSPLFTETPEKPSYCESWSGVDAGPTALSHSTVRIGLSSHETSDCHPHP